MPDGPGVGSVLGMLSKELYEEIPGLERPWRVVDVELDANGREVRAEIENEQRRLPCPVCAAARGTIPGRATGGIWTPASS